MPSARKSSTMVSARQACKTTRQQDNKISPTAHSRGSNGTNRTNDSERLLRSRRRYLTKVPAARHCSLFTADGTSCQAARCGLQQHQLQVRRTPRFGFFTDARPLPRCSPDLGSPRLQNAGSGACLVPRLFYEPSELRRANTYACAPEEDLNINTRQQSGDDGRN